MNLVNLGVFALTQLLQVIVHWPHMLSYCKGALPACQELALNGGDQEEYAVTNLEILGMGCLPGCRGSFAWPGQRAGAGA